MNVAHVHDRTFPVVWVDRTEAEREERLFVIVQDNAVAVVSQRLILDWAEQASQAVEAGVEDATLENLNGAYSWIGIQRPDSGEILPVTLEIKFYRELYVRYKVGEDMVCDVHKI